MDEKIKRQLVNIDWDFPVTKKGIFQTKHWYPGTFPSAIPLTLIEALSEEGDLVFDPFGGIGTTSAEALRLNRRAFTTDSNPVGVLSSYIIGMLILLRRGHYSAFENGFSKCLQIVNDKKNRRINLSKENSDSGFSNGSGAETEQLKVIPSIEYYSLFLFSEEPFWEGLASWIHPGTLDEVSDLLNYFQSMVKEDPVAALIGFYTLSSILRSISSQTKSWGHIADNVKPKNFVYKSVHDKALKLIKKLHKMLENLDFVSESSLFYKSNHNADFYCYKEDWSKSSAPENIFDLQADLLITSPPYAGAIDYTLSQKLSLYLMGYNEEAITRMVYSEVGARRKRFKPEHMDIWALELSQILQKQTKFVKDNGYICLILPHKDSGRENGPKLLKESLKESGWNNVLDIDRSIKQSKTRQSWTSIKKENLQIFQKG